MLTLKRILVISHNSISNTGSMGKTLAALFDEFKQDYLYQLYFHSYSSNVKMCNSSYEITDKNVLKSLFSFKTPGGLKKWENVKPENESVNNAWKSIYIYGRERNAVKLFARDIMWKCSRWDSKKLNNWIKAIQPDVIFYAAGYSMFSMDIAIKISQRYNIPLITYFCDDYYDFDFGGKYDAFIAKLRLKLYKKKVAELVAKSADMVFISESMRDKYDELFKKRGQVIMTPYTFKGKEKTGAAIPFIISYAGSVGNNRWKTILKIGMALDEINANGTRGMLDVYSNIEFDYISDELSNCNSIRLKGFVGADKLRDVYANTDFLLHAEPFSEADIVRIKHSVSTKIADSLASQRRFIAVGPSGIASIDYLKNNNAAYVIDNPDDILLKLKMILDDPTMSKEIVDNAAELAEKNHNKEKNYIKLKEIFENV